LRFNEICPEGFIHHRFPSFEFSIPKGRKEFLHRLRSTFPEEHDAIDKFSRLLDDLKGTIDSLSPADGSRRMKVVHALPHLPAFLGSLRKSVGGYSAEITDSVGLRSVIAGYSGEVGAAPALAALFTAYAFVHYEDGAYYPIGGSGAFRDAFVDHIRDHDGILSARSPVTSVRREGPHWAVTAGKRRYRGRTLVWNGSPGDLYLKVLEGVTIPSKLRRHWKGYIPSYGAFYLFAGIDLEPAEAGLGAATRIQWACDDVEQSVQRVLQLHMDSFILSCTSAKDPDGGHAPSGHHSIEAVLFLPDDAFARWVHQSSGRRDGEYIEFKNRLGEVLLANVQKAFPKLAGHIRVIDYATPVTNQHWTWSPGGGCYGHMQCVGQMGLNRFSSDTPLPGVYLCGSSTNMGGVYPAVFSGERAAARVHRFLRKPRYRRLSR